MQATETWNHVTSSRGWPGRGSETPGGTGAESEFKPPSGGSLFDCFWQAFSSLTQKKFLTRVTGPLAPLRFGPFLFFFPKRGFFGSHFQRHGNMGRGADQSAFYAPKPQPWKTFSIKSLAHYSPGPGSRRDPSRVRGRPKRPLGAPGSFPCL